jgi:hypothetical protein
LPSTPPPATTTPAGNHNINKDYKAIMNKCLTNTFVIHKIGLGYWCFKSLSTLFQ